MSEHFCITVRFLGGACHGRADRGEPEWPPSPLRLFQALVAAAARGIDRGGRPPTIIAPRGQRGVRYRTYVPDNVGDLLAGKWTRGDDGLIKRSEKDVQPTRLEDGAAVCYTWPLPDAPEERAGFADAREAIFALTESITHLGWGVDLVTAHAAVVTDEELNAMPGSRWRPAQGGSRHSWRVAVPGTLAGLERRHAAFLDRMSGGHFSPVPPLAKYALVPYADDAAPAAPSTAVFSLLRPDASGYRVYDPVRDGMRVAGMLRHAAADPALAAALGWDEEKVRRTVLGHTGPPNGGAHVPVDGPRLAFLPLPSYRPGRDGKGAFTIGSTRRVMLMGTNGLDPAELRAIARLLSGQMLIDEASGATVALLSRLPGSDSVVKIYTDSSPVWTTVTPMILPGHDDRGGYRRRMSPQVDDDHAAGSPPTPEQQREWLSKLDARTDALLRRAIRQAGYPAELAAHAALDWRGGGFLPGVVPASKYSVPQKLRRFRRLHVRIAWRDAAGSPVDVPGPVCLGGGRFMGLGLFCALK